MFAQVYLTTQQKRLIRQIAKIQINALRSIANNNIEEDLVMFCIEHDIPRDVLNEVIEEDLHMYKGVYKDPQLMFSLPGNDLSIIKTILVNCFEKRNKEAKRVIWQKLNLMERFIIYSSQN